MEKPHSTPPASAWVEHFAPLVPDGGTVLDLACGTGRHTLFFAKRGYRVTAVDRDTARLAGNHGAQGKPFFTADGRKDEDGAA